MISEGGAGGSAADPSGLPSPRGPCHADGMNAVPAFPDRTLGQSVDRLAETVAARETASSKASYTARLLAKGVPACAQKLGEEAVELAIAAVAGATDAGRRGETDEVVKEAADLVYHLVVLLRAAGVDPGEVGAELARREGISGLAEKATRRPDASAG